MKVSEEALFALSILIAGTIALFRFSKIDRMYYPFVFYLWIAGINEVLNFVLVGLSHHNTINNNIYVLAEAVLFTVFFWNIGIFEKFPRAFGPLITCLVLLWTWENFIWGKLTYVSSWFRITYSFLIVLMSITTVNKLVLLDINKPVEINHRHILKNSVLLICIGSVAYFTFKLLVEIFWLYGLNFGKIFRIKVYNILVYINLVINLVYALAVLWVPPKQPYIVL